MTHDEFFLRQAIPADEPALSRICLKTADASADATALYSEPRLPGMVWSVPYLHADPALCFVVARGDEVFGYVVGTADSEAFAGWRTTVWYRQMLAELTKEGFVARTGADEKVLSIMRRAEPEVPGFVSDYPAHLHINLLAPARAAGWGRRLIAHLSEALRERGVPAVHLGVDPRNPNAIGFYKHIGFVDIAPGSDAEDGIYLGKRLG